MDITEKKRIHTITEDYVDGLIDFEPTEAIKRAGIGKLQKSGATAIFNMLVKNGLAYLADEVGMGKTYIALAVMSLLRYQKPDARVLILTPRRNIQEKWKTDLYSFVQQNWLYSDHRVKTPHGSPDWPVLMPERLSDWVNRLYSEEPHDTILRMSSFSLGIDQDKGKEEISRFRSQLPEILKPKIDSLLIEPNQSDFDKVIREFIAPYRYDLIIVDEAHNLKYGYVPDQPSSNRNRSLYELFGKPAINRLSKPWLLLLSATPIENGDPISLVRQFQVFGRHEDTLRALNDDDYSGYPISSIARNDSQNRSRELQKRLVVRRVGELILKDQSRYTRNMYRREWRKGGVLNPEKPMPTPKPADQLVHAVLQKNVFDMLESQTGGKFRVGALESFEIYSGVDSTITEVDDKGTGVKLIDQHVISKLCQSYRETFYSEVPHPKLNAVSDLLARHISKRDKALVFVRRVATTTDLATRAAEAFDREILSRLKEIISSEDRDLIIQIQSVWSKKKMTRQFNQIQPKLSENIDSEEEQTDETDALAQSEVVPSLFSWFFRGKHRDLYEFPDIFSGRRLREQLSAKNRFSLILEENYVDWVLKRPVDLLKQLSSDTSKSEMTVLEEILEQIPNNFLDSDNFRRGYHSVQYAALVWMIEQSCYQPLVEFIKILLDEVFDDVNQLPSENNEFTEKFALSLLTTLGIYPQLSRAKEGSLPWQIIARGVFQREGQRADFDFRLALRRREQIRHMQMALLRHGAPMIDLYIGFIRARGGELKTQREYAENPEKVAIELAKLYLELSESEGSWRSSGGWELIEVKNNFDLLKKLNYPTLDFINEKSRKLDSVFSSGQEPANDASEQARSARRLLNLELAGQSPTTAAVGGQDDQRRHRITTQFKMPGMPWVIVATNVYEEGVDLHTYCKTVVHHGISHTASSVEQRTGRVDRIGGLLQRTAAELDSASEFNDEHKIQSLFPYPNDTFEKFQVRRVLANCNRFLLSLHDTDELVESREMSLDDKQDIPKQITTRLDSPFDVSNSQWLNGTLKIPDGSSNFYIDKYYEELLELETALKKRFSSNYQDKGGQGLDRHYYINGRSLRLSPRSHRKGDHLVLNLQIDDTDYPFDAAPDGAGWSATVIEHLFKTISNPLSQNIS